MLQVLSLRWRHNGLDSVSNHQPHEPFIRAQIKVNIKAQRHWPLCGKFTGDLWISRTNGQQRGKCFHLMTSSCIINKTTFTKCCFTQWISKLPMSFEFHWVRQYLVDFMGLASIVNAMFTRPSQFSQVLGMANYLCIIAYIIIVFSDPNHDMCFII